MTPAAAEIIAALRRFLGKHQCSVLTAVGELMLPFALAEANAGNAGAALLQRLLGGTA